jgi:adenine deaminase
MSTLVDHLAMARGDAPADLILRNAQLVNVWSGEIYATDIVIGGGQVVALGSGYTAHQVVDLQGRFVCPGFIDAHVHIESSLCTPPAFARAVLPHGVTTVVTDPHEIANVLGIPGIRFMLKRGRQSDHLSMFVMAPSCVPATTMETSGATLNAADLLGLTDDDMVLGLAEVMNYPGVVFGDEDMMDKLTEFAQYPRDGHCPALTGKSLNAYVVTGIGSEHECTTVDEVREKLRLGLTVFIREGTTTRNLKPLLPLVTPNNQTRMCFCTDDRQPNSLMDEGSIDFMVRTAIAEGIDPVTAIRMGTLNTAQYFRMFDRGVIAPGKRADMVVFSDVHDLRPEMVFSAGVLVAEQGVMKTEAIPMGSNDLKPSIHLRMDAVDFAIPAVSDRIRVIEGIGDQVVTGHRIAEATITDGMAVADTARDILKAAVIERHHATGKMGKGFIQGFGLKRGAIAGTVAHDHHNLIVIGADDHSMRRAVEAVVAMGGGLVAVDGDAVLGTLPLPVAGLMTEEPLEAVREKYDVMVAHAQSLGSTMPDPFMSMSFMGLEVIPSLKLTDHGLVDVEQFKLVDLFV